MNTRTQTRLDVRTSRERSADESRAELSAAYDETVEILEAIGLAFELDDDDRLAVAMARAVAWNEARK